MAIAFVNSKSAGPAGSSGTIASGTFNLTAGNLVVLAVRWFNGANTITNVTDTAGNTYSTAVAQFTNNDVNMQVLYCENALGNASNEITVTFSASSAVRAICVGQYSGVKTSGSKDQDGHGSSSGGTGTATSSSMTTDTADEVIVAFSEVNQGGSNSTPTWDAGYSASREDVTNSDGCDLAFADKIVSTTQTGITPSVSWTVCTSVTEIAVATFRAAANRSFILTTPLG